MAYFFGYLIGWIISGCIFGFIAQYIAESKGYETGFAWGFWLGVIGLLVVGFRPTITQQSYATQNYNTSLFSGNASSNTPKATGWECVCGAKNPSSMNYCLSCRRSKEEATEERVNCPHCGAKNKKSNAECFACGKSMKEESKRIEAKTQETKPIEATSSVQNDDLIRMLEKLAKLHEQGILTDEEFQQKKTEILSKM